MLDRLDGGDDTGTVFRDTIMLALAGFVALVILMLPYLNPKQTKTAENTEPPGNVIVEVRWPDGTKQSFAAGKTKIDRIATIKYGAGVE